MIDLTNGRTVIRADLAGGDGVVLAISHSDGAARAVTEYVVWRVRAVVGGKWEAFNGSYFTSKDAAVDVYDLRRMERVEA